MMQRKMKVSMDSGILCIYEEFILYTKSPQMSELVSVGISIFHSILERNFHFSFHIRQGHGRRERDRGI
jgi:hypothetical protein